MSEYKNWPIEKLKWELEKAQESLKEDIRWQESLPWHVRDGSIFDADRKIISEIEAELDRRGWK